MKKSLLGLSLMVVVLVLASCSATKYVPEGSYLLDEVQIRTDDKRVRPSALSMYVRQNPNAKWFSLIKTQLYVYNWSGADSTRWINRALRKMGDPPVIYSSEETARSAEEMEKAVRNMGFMGATVSTEREVSHKKLKLTYRVAAGRPYRVRSIAYDIPDERIAGYVCRDSAGTLLSSHCPISLAKACSRAAASTSSLYPSVLISPLGW